MVIPINKGYCGTIRVDGNSPGSLFPDPRSHRTPQTSGPRLRSQPRIQACLWPWPRPLSGLVPVGAPTSGFTKATVQRYRAHLVESGMSSSTVNLYMTAIRRLAVEAADNGLMQSELASGIGRVKGIKREGVRTGNWLTVRQAETLINTPDTTTLKGKRDRALLAVMIGCGLRREETALLSVEHIQQRDARWVIVDMHGKGAVSEPCQCLRGPKRQLMNGWRPRISLPAGYSVLSIKATIWPGRA